MSATHTYTIIDNSINNHIRFKVVCSFITACWYSLFAWTTIWCASLLPLLTIIGTDTLLPITSYCAVRIIDILSQTKHAAAGNLKYTWPLEFQPSSLSFSKMHIQTHIMMEILLHFCLVHSCKVENAYCPAIRCTPRFATYILRYYTFNRSHFIRRHCLLDSLEGVLCILMITWGFNTAR